MFISLETTRNLWRRPAILLGAVAAYALAGKLGLRLGIVHPSATAVWAPTGLSLAAVLLLGPWIWPALFAGAFIVNLTTAGSVLTALGIATGNTLEALAGAAFATAWAGGTQAFARGQTVVRFAFCALAACTLSATIGVTSLALTGYAHWIDFGTIWVTWWMGDVAGALLVAPPLLLWASDSRLRWTRRQTIEAAALLGTLVLVASIAFSQVVPLAGGTPPLGFLCIPVLIWAAKRFGPRETATGLALVAAIAVWQVVRETLPAHTRNDSLVLLQTFMAVTAVTVLVLAAAIAERTRVEERLRELATTDPLTGLANYRELLHTLESELRRSERTGRPFALLFFDLDRLKAINDRHGHMTGSRALCRVAEAIRASCRAIDTAARFGGDEFAVILPETEGTEADQVAVRVQERLAADKERPPVSVSVGRALYPRDGAAAEQLIAAADRGLYAMKKSRAKGPPTR